MKKQTKQLLQTIESWNRPIFIFDFDGTLANTEPMHLEAFKRVFKTLLPSKTFGEKDFLSFFGQQDTKIFADLAKTVSFDTQKALELKKFYSAKFLLKKAKIFKYFFVLRKHFASAPFFLASNEEADILTRIVEKKKLSKCFEKVFSMPGLKTVKTEFLKNISTYIPKAKYSDIILFEDSCSTLSFAKQLGMKTVAVITELNKDHNFDVDLKIFEKPNKLFSFYFTPPQ